MYVGAINVCYQTKYKQLIVHCRLIILYKVILFLFNYKMIYLVIEDMMTA
jgi:hypothetical protein